ncbi:MAG: hypothetical protein ABFE01_13410 [Phycisphaerales bacterium]
MEKWTGWIVVAALFAIGCVPQARGADGGPISCGLTQAGAIAAAGQKDTWTFAGRAGDRVAIAVGHRSGPGTEYFSLYPPGGEAAELADQHGLATHQLQQSGVYRIVVFEWAMDDTCEYALTFLNLTGCCGTTITWGQTLSGSLAIGGLAAYEFTGRAGDRIAIGVGRASGRGTECFSLFPPDGGPAELSDQRGLVSHQLAKSGVYKVVVFEWDLDDACDYGLTLLNLSERGNPGLLSGQAVSGNLPVGGLAAYEFTGRVGDRVEIHTACEPGGGTEYFYLYPPDGDVELCCRRGSVTHELQQSGVYTIVMLEQALDQACGYTLRVDFGKSIALPQVKTIDANGVTSASATLSGVLISDGGGDCQYRFRYGRPDQKKPNYTNWRPVGTGGAFEETVAGLLPRTPYCFEAEARNSAGIAKGGEARFTTSQSVRLTLSCGRGGSIEPNAPAIELPAPAQVDVVARANPGFFFWSWLGTAVDEGKVRRTDMNDFESRCSVFVDANDTLRAVFLRRISEWPVDVDRGQRRDAASSTSQLWDFADEAGEVDGIPNEVFDLLGPAPNGRPPLPGTFLTWSDPNSPVAPRWWPSDPYGSSERKGVLAPNGLHASVRVPRSSSNTNAYIQVVWRESRDAEPGLPATDMPPGPVLTDVEPFIRMCMIAEFPLHDGWYHTAYGWLAGPDGEQITFTIGGPILVDWLIVDTYREDRLCQTQW